MDTIDAFAKNLSTEGLNSFRHDLIRFFNTKVFDSTHNWDIVVKVDRKGIWIFNDLMKDAQISSEFVQISSFGIIDNQELFQHKKVLIFDDAIHHGTKIREEIDKINKLGVKSLTIAVLFANSDTYEKLKIEYKNIELICYKILNDSDYSTEIIKHMPCYFDYLCMPQPTDLIVHRVRLRKLSKNEIMQLFRTEKTKIEIVESNNEYDDRFKMTLDFSRDEIKDIKTKVIPKSIDLELSMCKIRVFVHISEMTTDIDIEYICIPDSNFSGCDRNFKYCFKRFDGVLVRDECVKESENSPVCLKCSIFNLTDYVANMLKTCLIAQKKSYEWIELPWILDI